MIVFTSHGFPQILNLTNESLYEHHGFYEDPGGFEGPQPAVLYVFKSPDMAAPLPIMPKEMSEELLIRIFGITIVIF